MHALDLTGLKNSQATFPTGHFRW